MNKPLVSILIPNYNKAPYIRETLDSVIAQTYTNWECIIVDDHSTDDSWEILEEYQAKDSRFKIYKRPDHLPKGGNSCRNYALKISVGLYCVFFDSDDILFDYCLTRRVDYINANPKADFWVFNVELFNLKKGDLGLLWNIDSVESDIKRFLKTDGIWQTTGPIYCVNFIKSVGGFDEKTPIWQDYELHFRSVLVSKLYYKFLDIEPDVYIRTGQDSLSHRKTYFGKKKILIQRISIYYGILDNYFKHFDKKHDHLIYSVIFSLTSDLFLKYGNWSKFNFFWKQAIQKDFISLRQYIFGLLSSILLKAGNRYSGVSIFFKYQKFFPNIINLTACYRYFTRQHI